ncbi:MAG: hypothetical protein DLD55_04235 [candidate division SR1 bacterium]|nr:MAG: hypothetical protein DLD55_04235 [candidate division SR1 bacterium]
MLRNALIKKYVNTKDIQRIIGHSSVVYIKKAIIMIVLLFLVYVVFALLNKTSPADYWKWIFGVIGLGLFVKWMIDFLNDYLDCLILSQDSLTFFLWEGLLEYKIEVFSWNKITTVSWSQNGIWDKLFAKGDLLIKLEFDTEFPFTDTFLPKKQLGKLMMLKESFLTKQKQQIEKDLSDDSERFNVLIEAMSEVVKEYMEKKSL